MKKVVIAIGLYFVMYTAPIYGQDLKQFKEKVQTAYDNSKLKLEEINFVSSYYQQNGNNSAVTGGIGTESLFNVGNSLDVTFSLEDKFKKKHTFNAQLNVDAYTSASSDNIDPATQSGASRSDVHVYPSLNYSVNNPENGVTKSVGLNYSYEYDYQSFGANLGISKLLKNNNTEIGVKGGVFIDEWSVILPVELRPGRGNNQGEDDDDDNYAKAARNTFYGGLSLSHIVNQNLQLFLTVEPTMQNGFLSTPFHRVYFNDGSLTTEKLPDQRLKLPIGVRASYFLGDNIILRGFYRYYTDSWGMTANTMSLEIPIKVTPFSSIAPFYRFNQQTAVDYFKPYQEHTVGDSFYTSDYDISDFQSHFLGLNYRKSTPGGVFGISHLNAIELRAGYYVRSNGLNSGIGSLLIKIK